MNKRPKEIEEIMNTIDNCAFDSLSSAVKALHAVVEYIKQLEEFKQNILIAAERSQDDGK